MFTCTDCKGPIDAYNRCACNQRAPALQRIIDRREAEVLRHRLREIEERQRKPAPPASGGTGEST